jgi:hypothetical protein
MDEFLTNLRPSRALADENPLRGRRQRECGRIDERIVEHHISIGEPIGCLPCEQVRIARPSADE